MFELLKRFAVQLVFDVRLCTVQLVLDMHCRLLPVQHLRVSLQQLRSAGHAKPRLRLRQLLVGLQRVFWLPKLLGGDGRASRICTTSTASMFVVCG